MHVGIVTIANRMNYGQRLQNYAVEQIISELGHIPETIMMGSSIFLTPRQRAVLRCNILFKRGLYKTGKRALLFDRFQRRQMHFSKDVFPDGDFDRYDCIVCGSDQLWNFSYSYLEEHKDFYFATFFPSSKPRIAFSASLGTDHLTDEQMRYIAGQVNSMKAVSVRESSSARLLRPLCSEPIEVTVDPVFVLPRKKWAALGEKPDFLRKDEPFILTYFLTTPSAQAQLCLQKLSEETGLRVVSLLGDWYHDGDNDAFYGMGPENFIYLMENSTVTLTDSFHACAFSCIFQRPFRWFPRTDGLEMNCRIENIFSLFSLGDWAIGNAAEPADHYTYACYDTYNSVIDAEREKAMRFLQRALQE